MDDPFAAAAPYGAQDPVQAKGEAWHAEQYRRSLDIIRVKNPTSKDFFIEWDHRFHKVPANGTADVYRFLATNYCRSMKDQIINEMNQQMHDEAIVERQKKGLPAFNNKYEENYATYMTDPYPKTNDWNLAAKIYADLWLGLVSEWGKDNPNEVNPRAGEVDQKPEEIKILESMQTKRVTSVPMAVQGETQVPEPAFSFSSMKQQVNKEELEKEVSV